MADYPRTLAEFEQRISNEGACRAYLARLRWPDGFRCPRCGRQVSVTAGTIFQDTRTPLTRWFLAMWLVTSQKIGASAVF